MFSRFRAGHFFLCAVTAAAILLFTGCSRAREPQLRRVALVSFEYQGSEARYRWMADALEAAVADQMRGAPGVLPVRAADANAAALQGATELLTAVVSGNPGGVRIRFYLEEPGRRIVKSIGSDAARPMGAALAALRDALEQAGVAGAPFSTSNPEAFVLFGRALRISDPAEAILLLHQATAADPQFTAASLRLSAIYQRANRPELAVAETERLLAALPDGRALDRAYAALQLASIRNDDRGAERALAAVVDAAPDDLEAANRLASLYQQRRRYAEAARVLRGVAGIDRTNPSTWNQIAYAEAFAGQKAAAMAAIERYRELAPLDPNVEDSAGDIQFFFGDFMKAAESYEKSVKGNPQWRGGFGLFKAAWARMYAGDLAGADAALDRYIGALRPANAPLADLRSAQWQFLRGRRSEARSGLNAIFAQTSLPRPYRSLVATQLYIWDLAEGGLDPLVREFGGDSHRYGAEVTPVLAALLRGTRPGLTPAQRADAIAPLAQGQQKNLLVAAATYLDARARGQLSAEGMQALVLADEAMPEAFAMVTHALAGWGFLTRGEPAEAALLFARRIPPVVTDDGLLWPLILPESLAWELDAWNGSNRKPPLAQLPKLVEELVPSKAGAR